MAFSPEFLDELRARVGLADVIGRRVRLVRKGREHSGLCPFHKEKTPSFTVNEEKGFYHCFGCGTHGSAIDFVMAVDGLGFREAVERLAEQAGIEIPADTPAARERDEKRKTLYQVMEAAAAYFERCLRMPESRGAMEYLRGRGLDDATIKHFRLGFAPDSRSGLKGALLREGFPEGLLAAGGLIIQPDDAARASYDRFRGRIMFPITDRGGRVIAFGGRILSSTPKENEPKYLNSPETPLFHKGRVLYGLAQAMRRVRDAGSVIVAEGYMDVIALSRAGFEHAVAPLGTALTEEHLVELWRLAREPVLCFDGDAAGQRAAARAAERALPLLKPGFGLRFAEIPAGEDPDTLIAKRGGRAIEDVLAQAFPVSEALWRIESGGKLPATPEARAALQQRLQDHTRRIADATVRTHFLKHFNDRIWPPNADRGRGRRAPASVSGATPAKAGSTRVDPLREAQQILIAIMVNNPRFFDRGGEELGSAEFPDSTLDQVRRTIVSLLSEDPQLAPERLRELLTARGYGDVLDALFATPVVKGHRLIRCDSPPEEVQETWVQHLNAVRLTGAAEETRQAARELESDLSEENWERQRALIEARLTDGADWRPEPTEPGS
ncbi:MAG: DNA primase [Rhodospirillales bacterium]|nr:DNA primase [Rhodospirillales bacterium]